jgi:hypothetical protein
MTRPAISSKEWPEFDASNSDRKSGGPQIAEIGPIGALFSAARSRQHSIVGGMDDADIADRSLWPGAKARNPASSIVGLLSVWSAG